jgi:hypothetical protein
VHGSLRGKASTIFNGDRAKARQFLTQFMNYWMVNDNHEAMLNPYQQTSIALGFIKGLKVDNWKAK